jgi:hypothetical protein
MPIRVMPDGSFICETPGEAIAMRDLLMERKAKETRREARRSARQTPSLAQAVATNGTATLVSVLKESPNGISSDDLAQRLGVTARSLPPLMLSLRRKARDAGHAFDDLLVRERAVGPNNRPISLYRLTDEGVRLLAS